MAKILTEQANLPSTSSIVATAGAGMHSFYARDLPRAINNLGTYVEPTFQFLMDASTTDFGVGPGPQLGRVWQEDDVFTGTMFVAQAPILLPTQARRLCWTLGFIRSAVGGEVTLPLDITGITLYLSHAPYRGDKPAADYNTTTSEFPTFSPGYLQPGCTSRAISSGGIQNGATNPAPSEFPVYGFVDDTDPGWENWMPPSVAHGHASIVPGWLIVAASFENAAINQTFFLKEFSIWGQYE